LEGSTGTDVEFAACDKCVEASEVFLARVRPVFVAMIACGVPREIANDAMAFMLDKLPDDTLLEPR
jgi:hypothetical protein